LGLDGGHLGFVEVVGAEGHDAEEVFGELDVAFDGGDGGAGGLVEGDDVGAALGLPIS
jgi:hypothetical protein